MTISRIGLDTSKHVFQIHGVDENEQVVLRRQVRRGEVEKFFAKLAPTRIGIEACGASHLVASRKRVSDWQRHHPQAEDIFLTPRAWRLGIANVLTNCTHPRARESWWLIEACLRALILRRIGDR